MGGKNHKVFRSAKKSPEVKSNYPEMDKRRKGKAEGTLITVEKKGKKLKIARTRDFDIWFSTPFKKKKEKKFL